MHSKMLDFVPRIDLFLGGVIVGLVVTLFTQLYVVKRYLLKPFSIPPEQASSEGDIEIPIDLPEELAAKVLDDDSRGTDRHVEEQKPLPLPENSLFFNMLMLHGFLALRDTRKMRERFEAWMDTKIMDLKKVIGSVSLVEYDLGNSAPFLTNCQLTESVVGKSYNRSTVYCDLRYTGKLTITLHVDLPFGYEGTVRIEVTEVSGAARIQVRSPDVTAERLTERDANWSISFLKDPKLQFTCTSSFKGTHIARITSLIEYQLKRSILRKHTLPNYWPRYILKDRLQIVPAQGPWIREKKNITPSALTSLGSTGSASLGTLDIHIDRCMNLGSIARRDILFRRRLYIVVMYGDGATRHRSPPVVVTDDTAIFDFKVDFSLFPEHRALDIKIFEKRRVSKDLRVATCQINLTRVYAQCCKRKDGEPFELSSPLALDASVITRIDAAERNKLSYQERSSKSTTPIPLFPMQGMAPASGHNTSLHSLQNEWLHNNSLPVDVDRSHAHDEPYGEDLLDPQNVVDARRSVPNIRSVESGLDEMGELDSHTTPNPTVRWRRVRSGISVPSRNSTDNNTGTDSSVNNLSKGVNMSRSVNHVNGVNFDPRILYTPAGNSMQSEGDVRDSDSDLSPRASTLSASLTSNAAVIIEPVVLLRFTLRKDDSSSVFQPSQPITLKPAETSDSVESKPRSRSHSASRLNAPDKDINRLGDDTLPSPGSINRSPVSINRSPKPITRPSSSTELLLQPRGDRRVQSGPNLEQRRLAFSDHTANTTPQRNRSKPSKGMYTRTHTRLGTLESSAHATQSDHSSSGSEGGVDTTSYTSPHTYHSSAVDSTRANKDHLCETSHTRDRHTCASKSADVCGSEDQAEEARRYRSDEYVYSSSGCGYNERDTEDDSRDKGTSKDTASAMSAEAINVRKPTPSQVGNAPSTGLPPESRAKNSTERRGGGCHGNALDTPDEDYVHVGPGGVSVETTAHTDTQTRVKDGDATASSIRYTGLIRAHILERARRKPPSDDYNDSGSELGSWELCAVCCRVITETHIYTCIECRMQFHTTAQCIEKARGIACAGVSTDKDTRFIKHYSQTHLSESTNSSKTKSSDKSDKAIESDTTHTEHITSGSKEDAQVDKLPSAKSLSELLGPIEPPKLIIEHSNSGTNSGTDPEVASTTAVDKHIESTAGLRELAKSIHHTLKCAFAMRQRLSDLQNKMGRLQRTHIDELLQRCEDGNHGNSTMVTPKGGKHTHSRTDRGLKGVKTVQQVDWQRCLEDIRTILERGEQEKIAIDDSIHFVNAQIGKMANEILDLCTVLGSSPP